MLKQRIITALILAPLVLAAIVFLSPAPFAVVSAVFFVLAAWEWGDLAGLPARSRLFFCAAVLLAFQALYQFSPAAQQGLLLTALLMWGLIGWWILSYPASQAYWTSHFKRTLMGLLVLVFAWLSLNQLKQQSEGVFLIFLLLAMVWGADIGAYFVGRKWGQRKLAPQVSPGKTWAGVYGALLSSLLVTLLMLRFSGYLQGAALTEWVLFGLLGVAIAAVSIMGDLAESMLKRYRGVKDSSRLLPGHGGILDRIDSLLAALPFYTLALIALGRL